jgi:alkanesulfonate monooxygenase SsuD/methylene tetrahydromethanopterin reductase-like flavin-dependent oxidoreductase (luciferase family)
MRFGISFSTFGSYSDVRLLSELAHEAEDSGWDGCFLWDHIQAGWPDRVADPWIALTAIVIATRRIRVGTLVTPLYRRRPWKVARESATLDQLSGGRLVLGVGLGSDLFREISAFGGPLEARIRAEMLDEALDVIAGLWTAQPFSFEGRHFRVDRACFMPAPLQQPRIPIWVAGTWPKRAPFRRAARYDGVIPVTGDIRSSLSPAQIKELVSFISELRGGAAPGEYQVVYSAATPPDQIDAARRLVAQYADAGATWWLESMLPWHRSPLQARDRIRAGPPR